MPAASISAVDMFNILRAKIGEKEAQTLTDYVAAEVTNRFEAKKDVLATKEDIHKLDLKIEQMKSELAKTIYVIGLMQFLAIVGSVIGIIAFMQHH